MSRHLRIVLLALWLGGRAIAGDLEVTPVRVDLSSRVRSAVVAIRNRSAESARYEVKVFAWDQTPHGEMKLSPTQDVVASPTVVQLAAGETRNLRVETTGGFGPVEKPYRLSIEELPTPAKLEEPSHVRVLSRVGIPVFLAPAKKDERAVLDDIEVAAGKVRFALRAAGTVHVRPAAVKVTGVAEDGAVVFEKSGDTWYVLAGSERRYDLGIPADVCGRVRRVRVEVTLTGGRLRDEVLAPRGACGP